VFRTSLLKVNPLVPLSSPVHLFRDYRFPNRRGHSMAVADPKPHSEPKVWNFFKLPFRHSNTSTTTTSSSANLHLHHHHHHHNPNNLPLEGSTSHTSNSVSSVARSLLPTRRRLKLDPSNKLYFPCINSSSPLYAHFSLCVSACMQWLLSSSSNLDILL